MIIDVLWGDSSGEKREARGEKRGARRGSGKVKSFFLLDMLGNYIRTKCVKNEIDLLIKKLYTNGVIVDRSRRRHHQMRLLQRNPRLRPALGRREVPHRKIFVTFVTTSSISAQRR